MLAHDTGVLSATTAFGKTVVAAWLIAQRGVSTLVLVHRRQLLEQWVERLSAFLGLPAKDIGRIGGGRRKPTGLLDVAVIQSLVARVLSGTVWPSTAISLWMNATICPPKALSMSHAERSRSSSRGCRPPLGTDATQRERLLICHREPICKFSQILNDGPATVGRKVLAVEVCPDQGGFPRPDRDGAKNIITPILPVLFTRIATPFGHSLAPNWADKGYYFWTLSLVFWRRRWRNTARKTSPSAALGIPCG